MKNSCIFTKLISLTTAMVMTSGFLVACGSNSKKVGIVPNSSGLVQTTDKKISGEIEVAAFAGGYGTAYWDQIVKDFEAAYPGVKVKLTTSPKLQDILPPRFVSGDVPDVVQATNNPKIDVRVLSNDNQLVDLSDVIESNTLDGNGKIKDLFNPGVLDFGTVKMNDKIEALPFNVSYQGLWYDAKVFTDNGWSPPETWDQFFDIANKVKAKYGDKKAFFTYQGIYPDYMHINFFGAVAAFGGLDGFNAMKDDKPGALESPAVLKALQSTNCVLARESTFYSQWNLV